MSAFCGNPDMTAKACHAQTATAATACHAQAAFPLNLQDNIFFQNSKLDTEGNRVLWLMVDGWVGHQHLMEILVGQQK